MSGAGIANSYGLDGPAFESWQRQEILSSSKPSIPAFGAYPAYFWKNVVVISRGLSDRVLKLATHLHLVPNLPVCLHGVERGNFWRTKYRKQCVHTIYLPTEICSLLWQYFIFSERIYVRRRSYGLCCKALTPFSSRIEGSTSVRCNVIVSVQGSPRIHISVNTLNRMRPMAQVNDKQRT